MDGRRWLYYRLYDKQTVEQWFFSCDQANGTVRWFLESLFMPDYNLLHPIDQLIIRKDRSLVDLPISTIDSPFIIIPSIRRYGCIN